MGAAGILQRRQRIEWDPAGNEGIFLRTPSGLAGSSNDEFVIGSGVVRKAAIAATLMQNTAIPCLTKTAKKRQHIRKGQAAPRLPIKQTPLSLRPPYRTLHWRGAAGFLLFAAAFARCSFRR